MSSFLDHFPQKELMIRDFPSKTPLFFRDVSMMLAIFEADAKVAKQYLPSSDFKLISPFPGRALIGINCFEYKDSDIGPYNEVSIAIAVENKKWKPGFVSVFGSTLTQNFHANILQLPVTTDVALHGGLDFFNYPKYKADIEFIENETNRTCIVKDNDELLFAFKMKKIKTKTYDQNKTYNSFNKALFNSYPIMNNQIMKADLLVNQIEKGTQWMGKGFTVEIGNHQKSQLLKELKLGRLMQQVYMPKGEAVLMEPSIME